MDKVLIIVPAYNEAGNIAALIEKLRTFERFDFVIINDCSKDNTRDIARSMGANYIDLPVNLGIGGAVQTGYKYAYNNGYDIAVQIDGDGQHNPEYISEMVEKINAGANMVIGSRYITKEGFQSTCARRLGIGVLRFWCKILTGKTVTDPTSGFRACNRKVIERFAGIYPRDYPEPETLINVLVQGYSVEEIPVLMNARESGVSSISMRKSIYYMIKVSLAMILARLQGKD